MKMNMREIRTKWLLLRPFRESDYDDLFEFLSQLEDDEFEGYPGITYENGREHLKYRLGSEEFYAIELTEAGKVIGNIYCGNRDFAAREVGYIVNKRYQKKGYATEALTAVIARHSGKARTGFTRNVIQGMSHRGSCWRRWECGARRVSGRTFGFAGTKTASLFGRIRWYTRFWRTRRRGNECKTRDLK